MSRVRILSFKNWNHTDKIGQRFELLPGEVSNFEKTPTMEATFQFKQIMDRYQTQVDKNLLYSFNELTGINVDRDFIYVLLRSFESEGRFSEEDYALFPLQTVVDYIQRTHRYYLEKKLCEIEQSIDILLKDYDGNHPLLVILNKFYGDYRSHLTAHIQDEEARLLPYIKALLKAESREIRVSELFIKDSPLRIFTDNHLDTEEDISIVRNAILQYDPPATNQTPYRILVSQLAMFEKDLGIHSLIEDRVLIPRALELEAKLQKSSFL